MGDFSRARPRNLGELRKPSGRLRIERADDPKKIERRQVDGPKKINHTGQPKSRRVLLLLGLR